MKAFYKVMKVLIILAAIAGIIYVIAVYGERIVAKAKALLNRMRGKEDCFYEDDECDLAEAADFEA